MAIYSTVSGLIFVAAFVLASAGFGQAADLVDLAGLFHSASRWPSTSVG